ncbi:NADH-ubiquinone oxidoreductase-F iron-sulfur binding region domain-containing protein [Nocardioides sp. LHG3406-4]|uniref:NADH-ubiquinone oxidoreductase-F iron-sulfur binding region domain-containing protein n=1 Tax=Nocardioides sp. LHG3406-4 TaxID=2804575 RepID=UPI003CE95941
MLDELVADGRTVEVVPSDDSWAEPGLLGQPGPREDLTRFRAGHPVLPAPSAAALVDLLRASDLRGRGGAGFPAWRKVETVAAGAALGPVAVVANGEEGEPASAKDRYLLRRRPHLVLEGLAVVRDALGATSSTVYLSDPGSEHAVRRALIERDDAQTRLFMAPRRYVSGEETAVVRALDGGPALPVQKPPRPFESGVGGLPTAVMNVETLARVAQLWHAGSRGPGGLESASRFLLTLVGPERAVLVEADSHQRLRDVIDTTLDLGSLEGAPILAGGFFSGFMPPGALDVPLGFDELHDAGTGLGCGSFLVLPGSCPVDVATDVLGFFDRENAHQCGSCFKGTAAMHQALGRLGAGTPTEDDRSNLARWSQMLPGRGSCAALDGAAAVVGSLLAHFGDVVDRHLHESCGLCLSGAGLPANDTRFRVSVP